MFLAVGVDVRIPSCREVRGMAEIALDFAQAAALVEEQGRAGVPQVVETDLRQIAVRNPPAKMVRHILRREQLA